MNQYYPSAHSAHHSQMPMPIQGQPMMQYAQPMQYSMVQQPAYGVGQPMGYYPYGQPSFGDQLRHFFGLAPKAGVRYKSDRGTWGFMGYSRRQRYVDPRTGQEVDRQGRPVYRV